MIEDVEAVGFAGKLEVADPRTWGSDLHKDRLVKVTKPDGTMVEHVYDVDGNRVRTTVTPASGPATVTNYLVDACCRKSQVVAETDGAGAVQAYYVRAGDELLAVIRGGEVRYYISDGLGSVRALADSSGTFTDTYSTTAFGESVARTGSDLQPYGFAGEAFEGISGLSYNRARWMSPTLGRFVSEDPARGAPDLSDLQPYVYAENDPVDLDDPTGLDSEGLYIPAGYHAFVERASTRPASFADGGKGGVIEVYCRYTDWNAWLGRKINQRIRGPRHCGVRVRYERGTDYAADITAPDQGIPDQFLEVSAVDWRRTGPLFWQWDMYPVVLSRKWSGTTGTGTATPENPLVLEPAPRLPGFASGEAERRVLSFSMNYTNIAPPYRILGPNSNTYVSRAIRGILDFPAAPPNTPGWDWDLTGNLWP